MSPVAMPPTSAPAGAGAVAQRSDGRLHECIHDEPGRRDGGEGGDLARRLDLGDPRGEQDGHHRAVGGEQRELHDRLPEQHAER
jgi:hypothetical protein